MSSGLRHKKVLLVLDDVSHKDQLEKLAGECDWFGLGSWIIITTRDEHVLVDHGVPKIYKPNGLDYDDALKLFCLKAFKKEQPQEGYMQLSQKVVKYANGLPLALVTLGSFLVGRTIDEWQSALQSFKNTKGDIYDILKISYDGLEEMWKEIFLDIACFFRRWETKDRVIQILENCGFNARIGISVLLDKSLLTIGDYEHLGMHDLLQGMAEKIVHFGLDVKHGKQSRLWRIKDLLLVSENDKAIEAIQAIVIHYRKKDFYFEEFPEVLSKMSNLRLMIIDKTDYLFDQGHLVVPNDQRQLFVPNQLRHLSWNCCPLKCLSSSSQPKKLVQLDLQYSRIEYLWEGVMISCCLKYIDLSDSKNLIRTPDFSGVPILEELNLSGCVSLVEIHPSIGQLYKLRYLHLRKCESLTDLPSMSAKMQSLDVLALCDCSKISTIPKFTGIMKSLSELNLGYTDINKLEPSSIECLTALTLLDLSFCTNLEYLPSNMDNLRSLEKLILYGCEKLKSLPRLPSTVRFINAQYCNSLKWITARVKLSSWSQPLSQWCPYDERSSRLEFTILFHFLQELLCHKTVYKIPSCLTHQSVRNSISIELPSNWYNSKWIRFALWASVSGFINFEDGIIRARVIALGDMPLNHCDSKLFTTWIHCEVRIGLLYLSRDEWFATVGNGECNQIKVIFENDKRTIDVRECGVSLIYEQDVDEFNQTNAQCLIESFGEEVSIYKLTVGDDDDDYYYDAYTVIDDDGDDTESWC
ncbi:TMV resistance protein N-like isoform X2 [Quercus lobata]|uniref:TMV resistance protein N-like isoform X2 n=1 Tax=Quercus lobata TaxID=97700 RepID=UPI0012455819|nr:TMV resistance protein N-like isoform X2 [Quercus lobata]